MRAASSPHEVLRWLRAAAPRSAPAHLQGSESSGGGCAIVHLKPRVVWTCRFSKKCIGFVTSRSESRPKLPHSTVTTTTRLLRRGMAALCQRYGSVRSVLCQFYASSMSVLRQFYGSVRSVLCQFYVRGSAPRVAPVPRLTPGRWSARRVVPCSPRQALPAGSRRHCLSRCGAWSAVPACWPSSGVHLLSLPQLVRVGVGLSATLCGGASRAQKRLITFF